VDGGGFYYVVSVSDWGDDGGASCWGIIIIGVIIIGVIVVNVIVVIVIVIVIGVSLNNVDIFRACGDIVIIIVLKIVIKIFEIIVI